MFNAVHLPLPFDSAGREAFDKGFLEQQKYDQRRNHANDCGCGHQMPFGTVSLVKNGD
jgi:hypothetical protein